MLRTSFWLCLFLLCLSQPAVAAQGIGKDELKAAVREVIKENPELIMDILRDNSVDVLEIAQLGGQEKQRRQLRAQWQEDLKQPKKIARNRPIQGDANAPVLIVAYSDYTCPYCAKANATVEQVMAARQGKVKFMFKHFPYKNHPLARLSSEYVAAAFEQDEAKGWALHHAIFAAQESLAEEGEGFLRTAALAVGLNMQKLGQDIKSRKVRSIIDEDLAEGEALGITATPHHFINDLAIRGAAPLTTFLEGVDLALSQVKK